MWWNIVTGAHVWCGNARHPLTCLALPLLDAPAPLDPSLFPLILFLPHCALHELAGHVSPVVSFRAI